jgi:hypothetical protein
MRIGTNHFVSLVAAQRYYVSQGECSHIEAVAIVNRKVYEGFIGIGEPRLKPGQTLGVDTVEGRYFIEDGTP